LDILATVAFGLALLLVVAALARGVRALADPGLTAAYGPRGRVQ